MANNRRTDFSVRAMRSQRVVLSKRVAQPVMCFVVCFQASLAAVCRMNLGDGVQSGSRERLLPDEEGSGLPRGQWWRWREDGRVGFVLDGRAQNLMN